MISNVSHFVAMTMVVPLENANGTLEIINDMKPNLESFYILSH